jgi:lipoprotein-anchoring transpeptidase ErfK/SrfK
MWKDALVGVVLLFAQCGSALADVRISVDTFAQQMTVFVDGAPRHTWPVSTGGQGYSTPAGSFRPFRLEVEHYSQEWDDAPMPHSIFFTELGHAIHGTKSTASLGSPVSHGCVRLAPGNAALLFTLVQQNGLGNTQVEVVSSAWAKKPYESFGVIGDQSAGMNFDSFIELLDGR